MEVVYLAILFLLSSLTAHTQNIPRNSTSLRVSLPEKSPSEHRKRQFYKRGFVTTRADGHLYLGNKLFDFRGFNAPTLLVGGDFQAGDLLATIGGFANPVTRTYPLRIANTMFGGYIPPSSAQVIGWNHEKDDWIYNETKWEQIDRVLDSARRYGVKLIMPIINQNYGSPDSDFVGNFNDLIRHRFGIKDYFSAQKLVDWFTDHEMLRAYKKLLTKFLDRINTVNNIRYGDDQTIMAIETCNEANWAMNNYTVFARPPPANWTLSVARHIKSLAPRTLVMDGSYARNITRESVWEEDVLKSKDVDLFSYHLYGNGDIAYYDRLNSTIRRYGKALVIGEHGFYSQSSLYRAAYHRFDCAGALIWSLTAHSDRGGFVTHSEGSNIFSYHIPGWEVQTAAGFDTQEHEVVHSTYEASYAVLGLKPPPFPVPGIPHAFFVSNGTNVGISWRGAAWAYRYEVFGAHVHKTTFNLVAQSLNDNVEAGTLFLPVDPAQPTKNIVVQRLPAKPHRSHAGWIDDKWENRWTRRNSHTTTPSEPLPPIPELHPIPLEPQPKIPEYQPDGDETRSSTIERWNPQGGWWMVRGRSVDDVPGPFSKPIFLTRFWNSSHH
ncbi:hypothetical protein CROQUDRAFT_61589 [Cronartium quercuum f. sp. fusiforme G11]|uniref:mannan endo-1,4-beta-mannosidase n=1 Tax=Cronartium quercuum f. sp. fusiforme G11 TaxID=708437 RepID=A0A9P6NKD8_9BASI|nr:hypothetical protein CROQUDRAFT_61589 [Cronartium quercuum f. sp. fusiforme G11]